MPAAVVPDWESFYASYRKPGYVPGYEITSKLGGGMFGLVFRARKQSIGKDYALKFLKVDDAEVRRAIVQELEQVRYFAQVDHPNLVSIEDRGEVDGIPYLVMNYAGSETLKDRLPCKAEERDELLRYFLQACRGVSALHERSLVHFDLKPANVFLKGGVARVGDYGLSKLVTHSRGSLSMGRGTPYYMAPEMLQRRGDQRSDVYSLGVMLYEILAGEVPFRGDSEWEVLRKHEREELSFPASIGPRERAVLARCLAKDPDQRYQRVDELVAALAGTTSAGAAAAQPVARRPAPPPEPVTPRRRFGLGHLVFLALIGIYVTTRLDDPDRRHRVRSGANVPGTRTVTDRSVLAAESHAATVETFVRQALSRLEDVNRRRVRSVKLRPLDTERTCAPPDLDRYEDELERLASEPAYSPGLGRRLLREGRAMCLAAVDWLQQCDYGDEDDCRAAANVHAFLRDAVGIQALSLEAPPGEIDRVVTLRFQTVADQWRRFAEQFLKDEEGWRRVLATTGAGGRARER